MHTTQWSTRRSDRLLRLSQQLPKAASEGGINVSRGVWNGRRASGAIPRSGRARTDVRNLGLQEEPDPSGRARRRQDVRGQAASLSASRGKRRGPGRDNPISPVLQLRGLRPGLPPDGEGRLRDPQDGVFHRFCEKARLRRAAPRLHHRRDQPRQSLARSSAN